MEHGLYLDIVAVEARSKYVKWSLCWKSEHQEDTELILYCLWNAERARFAKAKDDGLIVCIKI